MIDKSINETKLSSAHGDQSMYLIHLDLIVHLKLPLVVIWL